MENGPEGFWSAGDRKTRAGEIITGLERLWGKNLWCIPMLF